MASDVPDLVDALARDRIAAAVEDVEPQGELLALQQSLGLPVTEASRAMAAKRGPGRPSPATRSSTTRCT